MVEETEGIPKLFSAWKLDNYEGSYRRLTYFSINRKIAVCEITLKPLNILRTNIYVHILGTFGIRFLYWRNINMSPVFPLYGLIC